MAACVSIILVSLGIDTTRLANRQLCDLLCSWLLGCGARRTRLLRRLRHHLNVDKNAVARRLTVLLVVIVALGGIRTTPCERFQADIQTKLVFLLSDSGKHSWLGGGCFGVL